MSLTRDSAQDFLEKVDEAKQWMQEARTASDMPTRKKKLAMADEVFSALESLMTEKEG